MEDFDNPRSSPYKALEWIVSFHVAAAEETVASSTEDAASDSSSTQHWLEMYALAVVYFATHPHATPRDATTLVLETPHSIQRHRPKDWIREAHSGTTVCHWEGVHCGHRHRVVRLNVTRSGLSGSLPAELAGLHRLIDLDGSGNQIAGTLPAEWSELSHLQRLSLVDNQLKGTVPPSWERLRAQLEVLDLSHNDILSGTMADTLP